MFKYILETNSSLGDVKLNEIVKQLSIF